jgi:hypothetical protein
MVAGDMAAVIAFAITMFSATYYTAIEGRRVVLSPNDQLRNLDPEHIVSPKRREDDVVCFGRARRPVLVCAIIGIGVSRADTMHHGDTYDT